MRKLPLALAFVTGLLLASATPARAEEPPFCAFYGRPAAVVAADLSAQGIDPLVALVGVLAVQDAFRKAPELCP